MTNRVVESHDGLFQYQGAVPLRHSNVPPPEEERGEGEDGQHSRRIALANKLRVSKCK